MKELNVYEIDMISGGAGTAGAPPVSGNEYIEAGRVISDFVSGFLQGFYDAF
ncbi:hypothetical protein [Stenotrophomonas sp. 57]|uniref:hypothetical protein n=1 Tax=Stenotrophomonas sp. 57 TaxID=3051119 RepID=UPI00256EF6D5|nr:hypothetical protein [Stenotrophomonas sp. 57]